jgi:uncharacterized surface protein with fasciclin (FAS1) repeats
MNRTFAITLTAALLSAAGVTTAMGTLRSAQQSERSSSNTAPAPGNLVQVAQQAGSFGTLLKAAQAAGLAQTLASPGPFTVFAPTDDAFRRLGSHAVADLLKPENKDKLRAILLLHVVPAQVSAAQAAGLREAKTAAGPRVSLSLADGRLRVAGVAITATDIQASNGVIHVIDRVITPDRAKDALPEASSESAGSAESMTPVQLMQLAIERGSGLFNRGDADACAALYEVACRAMLAMSDSAVTPQARTALRDALNNATQARDDAAKAWALREGLDRAMALLTTRQ